MIEMNNNRQNRSGKLSSQKITTSLSQPWAARNDIHGQSVRDISGPRPFFVSRAAASGRYEDERQLNQYNLVLEENWTTERPDSHAKTRGLKPQSMRRE